MNSEDYQGFSSGERRYADGTELQVLDILDVRILQPLPKDHQSENWMLDTLSPWTKVSAATVGDLAGMIDNKATLWLTVIAPLTVRTTEFRVRWWIKLTVR